MGKRAVLILAVAVMAMVILPATAFGGLINEYGMHFAGQTACTACHAGYADQLHGRFATPGLSFPAPEEWTVFRAAGDMAPVAGTAPARFSEGGWYSIAGETWLTLGDTLGNAAGE